MSASGTHFHTRPAVNDEPSTAEWPALMARAQAGDQVAYNRLLKAMVPALRSIARRQISDDGLLEDVVQDALLVIHRIRHTYDPSRPILPWVTAIATARAIDALRSRGRRLRREVKDDESLLGQTDATADAHLEGGSMRSELIELLDRLPVRQRRIVEMVSLKEMSLSEAASASSLSISAVKALLHRALTKLRRYGVHDRG